ncbi:MAG: DMT family transporter [Acidimicrobiia bacterium]|nr:DMT family transporter [Acidimicrobiia bacterium]MXZ07289.1 DMT family transporter [Acidimicrobiia bacterium]MYD05099.1 DMT family transporter [Acidimicrobiia bacterium]MYF26444.1 DMT family transporter [Acidimicrobiia bacterium]MYH56332.1 DMT family transporter [Acidimicrobiia bacterium]
MDPGSGRPLEPDTGSSFLPGLLGPSRVKGIMLVATAGALWSTLGLGVRIMDSSTPWQILFYRAVPQLVFITIWVAMRRGHNLVRSFTDIGLNGVLAGACVSMSSIAFVNALTLITVAEAMFIFSMAPILAGLLGWLVLREPITRITWVAMGLVMVGIGIMNGPGHAEGLSIGTFLAFIGASGFAGFTVLQRRRPNIDMLPAVAVSGLITMATIGWKTVGVPVPDLTDLLVALWLGGVALAGGLALYTIGARQVRSAESVVISMTEIILGPVWVWWLLDETVTFAILSGGAVVASGVVIQALLNKPTPPDPSPTL